MTIEDIREFRENAISILKKNSQYATANAVEQAFSAMICLGQFVWERDIAVSQLEELGLGFGQKIDGVKELIERDRLKPPTVYDNCGNKGYVLRCPNCFELIDNDWKFCSECGQRIDV